MSTLKEFAVVMSAMVACTVGGAGSVIATQHVNGKHNHTDSEIVSEYVNSDWFSLIRIAPSGDEYVIDYNMSLEDCMKIMAENKAGVEADGLHHGWACENQPDQEGQPDGYINDIEWRTPV